MDAPQLGLDLLGDPSEVKNFIVRYSDCGGVDVESAWPPLITSRMDTTQPGLDLLGDPSEVITLFSDIAMV